MAPTKPTKNNWRVLIDLNILLDVLMRREPYFANSARVWALVESGQVDGHVAAHSFTTLFYLYRRHTDRARAYAALQQILQVFSVAQVNQAVIESAVQSGGRDFEDAVQAAAAQTAGCDYLITRNRADFGDQPVTAIEPPEFLAIWSADLG